MQRHLASTMPLIGICLAALSFSLGTIASVSAKPPQQANNPLVLQEQGNFYVGGTIEFRGPNTTNIALPGDGTAPGHIAVNQAYVQVPNSRSEKVQAIRSS